MGVLITSVCMHFMWLSDLFNKLVSSSNKHQDTSLNRNKQIFEISDESNWIEDELSTNLNISHVFNKHSYSRKTICQYCTKPLKGLIIKGLQCENCQLNVHKKCVSFVAKNCNRKKLKVYKKNAKNCRNTINDAKQRNFLLNVLKDIFVTKSKNIPLKHFLQNAKKTTNNETIILYEGWMVYYTNNNTTPKLRFWRFNSKGIIISESEESNYYQKIPIPDILSVTLNESNGNFELKTKHCIYFVYDYSIAELNTQENTREYIDDSKNYACKINKNDDINFHYQILNDALGSGQFGTVYAGFHRATLRPVAIKVIDKSKFPNKQEDQFKNEVSILKNIHFPGVINLYHVFETNLKIYMVMEKLKGDMLSMILSSEKKRLTERCTKFLIYQIFIALKYLHSQNIVHCDLKPENVLLSSDSHFPQVKLCDFGFARIIGEKSFRRSIVGTPAYVAPEVLRNKGYNRSLDIWSVGVIIYVSLSGRFPFSEKEDIADQIMNTASMYPEILWKDISAKAINLIDNLLQVKPRNRYTVNRSLNHIWFQDYQIWCDMRDLEKRVGSRWLTQESDDARWESYRKMNNIAFKIRNKSSEDVSVI